MPTSIICKRKKIDVLRKKRHEFINSYDSPIKKEKENIHLKNIIKSEKNNSKIKKEELNQRTICLAGSIPRKAKIAVIELFP